MKRRIITFIAAAAFACGAIGFTACKDKKDPEIVNIYNQYVAYAESEGKSPLSYEEWLNSIKGADGVGIRDVYINDDGDLIVMLTNGQSNNCGNISHSATVDDGLFYQQVVDENGTFTGYAVRDVGSVSELEITIPSQYRGKPVIAINDFAFYNCKYIKKVTIPDSVKNINYCAFSGCDSLEEVTLGSGVEIIGDLAFAYCGKLEKVNFPASLTLIGESAFASCTSLKELKLSYGITEIGRSAFTGCVALETVEMPDSVTTLGFATFMESIGIRKVSLSANLTEIPERLFSGCVSITEVELGDRVQTIGYSAFYNMTLLEYVVVPNSVTEIVSYAFSNLPEFDGVYYKGTEVEWNAIKIGKNGNEFSDGGNEWGKVYFYSASAPATAGNYWHYVDGVPAKW